MAVATFQGMEQKGEKPVAALQDWYTSLAGDILGQIPNEQEGWTDEVRQQQRYAAEVAGRYKLTTLVPALQKLFSQPGADEDTRAVTANALMDISGNNG